MEPQPHRCLELLLLARHSPALPAVACRLRAQMQQVAQRCQPGSPPQAQMRQLRFATHGPAARERPPTPAVCLLPVLPAQAALPLGGLLLRRAQRGRLPRRLPPRALPGRQCGCAAAPLPARPGSRPRPRWAPLQRAQATPGRCLALPPRQPLARRGCQLTAPQQAGPARAGRVRSQAGLQSWAAMHLQPPPLLPHLLPQRLVQGPGSGRLPGPRWPPPQPAAAPAALAAAGDGQYRCRSCCLWSGPAPLACWPARCEAPPAVGKARASCDLTDALTGELPPHRHVQHAGCVVS